MRRVPLLVLAMLLVTTTAPAADDVYKPNENLVADGIPPLPMALAEQVNRYTEFRSATLFDWHPTNGSMLVGTRFGQTTQVHQVKFPGAARTQLTFFAEGVAGAKYQPTKGDYFVFSRDVGGNERYQNFRYDLVTGNVTLLTDGKSRNSLGVWSKAGDRMAYTSTRRNGKDTDVYAIDPTDPKSDKLLTQVEGSFTVLDWSPDGTRVLAEEYVSIHETYLWLIDTKSGAKTALTPKGDTKESVAYSGGKFSPDGRLVWTASDQGSEFRRLTRIELATGARTPVGANIPWDVEDVEPSPDGQLVAFVTNEAGVGRLRLIDATTGQPRGQFAIPPGSVSGLKWNRDGSRLGFHVASAQHPRDVFSLSLVTGQATRWTESETGGLNTSQFPEPELVTWKSFDGREISGFLYKPPAAKFPGKRPVIVNIHGGPESQFRPTFLGSSNYYLNELGIAIFYPNVRGSSGYGKTFLQLDNGVKREDAYKDVGSLLDWLRGRPDVDADRVMVMGGSYGGHMTLMTATLYADRIRCAVDVVGISNLRTFLENTEPYRRDLRRAEYGDERDPKVREFFERTAPVNNVAKITKPLFVIQGLNDPRVPASEAEQMVAALKKQKTPVWYLVAKDEGHGFAKKKNVEFQAVAVAAFAKRYLLDE
jgi:dipeptidyl aminopeptidase/acylaminoacyl peptidase